MSYGSDRPKFSIDSNILGPTLLARGSIQAMGRILSRGKPNSVQQPIWAEPNLFGEGLNLNPVVDPILAQYRP